MSNTYLGKIENIWFGHVGYQNCQFGYQIEFKIETGCICTNAATWAPSLIKHTEHCQWSEEERDKELVNICTKLSSLLKEAKVQHVHELKNKPVEVTLKEFNGPVEEWRLLTEVL